jgi:hypothetical protein
VKAAGILVLALGVCEQLDRRHVGVAVDDAAGQHRARFRHLGRALLDARYEIDERHDIAGEPDQQRNRQQAVGLEEQDQGADPMHDDPHHHVAGVGGDVADRRADLDHARRHAPGKVVLEEAEALAQHVAMGEPAGADVDRALDQLLLQ